MTGIKMTIDAKEVERANKLLAGIEGGPQKALYNAIKRGQAKVRTETTRAISGAYAITQQNIRAATNIKSRIFSSGNEIIGEVEYAGHKIPLHRFSVSPQKPAVDTKTWITAKLMEGWKTLHPSLPVSATIKRGGQRTTSTTAFVAQMKSGHIGVFERLAGTNKIRERMGLATAQMARNSMVLEDVERQAQETVTKRLDHEITRILNGFR